jgi:hypothetical protein
MMWPDNGRTEQTEQIRDFVMGFFRVNKVMPKEVEKGIWSCRMPEGLSQLLNYPEQLAFTFDPSLIKKGVELITLGSPLLEGMLLSSKNRGRTCSLIFVNLPLLQEFDEYILKMLHPDSQKGQIWPWEEFKVLNAKQRAIQTRLLFTDQILFSFKASFISDEKQEELISLLADPMTEEVDQVVDLNKGVAINLKAKPVHIKPIKGKSGFYTSEECESLVKSLKEGSYNLYRLYRKACDHMEILLANRMNHYEQLANQRLENEVGRVQEYFHSMAIEAADPLRRLWNKMNTLDYKTRFTWVNKERYEVSLRQTAMEVKRIKADYQKGLTDLELDRQRRLAELQDKYRLKVEIELTNAASVKVPRIESRIRLSGPSRREITILYDVLRRRFLDLTCENCEKSVTHLIMCTCGDLLCQDCLQKESSDPLCLKCAEKS